jgi:CHAD domain-containing protein
MAYRFKRGEKIEPGLKRIAAEQLDELLAQFDDDSLSVDERVHLSRKRSKKVRGLLRLVRPALGSTFRAEHGALRDAARLLSPARDVQIVIATYDALAAHTVKEQSIAVENLVVRDWLLERRQQLVGEPSDLQAHLAEYRERISAMRDRIGDWRLKKKGVRAVRQGFQQTYAAAKHTFAIAVASDGVPAAYHQWRRRVKDHWCHLLLLEQLWPPVINSHSDRVNELAGLLGQANDLGVLLEVLRSNPRESGEAEPFDTIATQRQKQLQAKARTLGADLFQARPKRISKPITALWSE